MKQKLTFILLTFFMVQFIWAAWALEMDKGKFLSWSIHTLQKIEETEKISEIKALKQKPVVESEKLFHKDFLVQDDVFNLVVEKDLFYTEIYEVFKGDYQKAVDLYWDVTVGKSKVNLFLKSGAGKKEDIQLLKNNGKVAEFVTERVYESRLAYNTKQTARLRKFVFHSPPQIVIVNEQVKDWGADLKEKKIQREGKFFYPVYFDLNVDVYRKLQNGTFLYVSFSTYQGQGLQTPYTSLNAAKGVGNLLSFGMLKKGLGKTVKKSAITTWENRKKVFQKLLLK